MAVFNVSRLASALFAYFKLPHTSPFGRQASGMPSTSCEVSRRWQDREVCFELRRLLNWLWDVRSSGSLHPERFERYWILILFAIFALVGSIAYAAFIVIREICTDTLMSQTTESRQGDPLLEKRLCKPKRPGRVYKSRSADGRASWLQS